MVARVQSKATTSGGTSVTVTLDAAPTRGNLLVAVITVRSGGYTWPGGWLLADTNSNAGSGIGATEVRYRFAQTGDPAATTVTGLSDAANLIIHEYSGVPGVLSVTAGNGAAVGAVMVLPTITPPDANTLLLFLSFSGWPDSDQVFAVAPYTFGEHTFSGGAPSWRYGATADRIVPSASGAYGGETITAYDTSFKATIVAFQLDTALGGITGPSLLVEYFDNDVATFGPSTLQGVILDAIKIGWSWYSRYPSNAFFTLRANSVHNLRLLPLQTHIRITYYNPRTGYSKVVFTGRLSEPDHSGEDVVWTAWNYLSELSLSRSGYRTLYPGKLLGTEIAQVEWNAARTATYALLNFVTTGTIQNPLGTDEVTPIVTDNRFGVIDVPRLLLMFDLTEIGRANTVHNVTMGITRESPFSFFFLKNAGAAITGKRLIFPGNVRDFHYVPGYAAIRNDLATIGTAADGSAVEIVKTDEVNALAYGRRQDVFTIKTLQGQVGAPTESDAQNAITARAVKEATTLGQSVLLDVRPELVEPFDGWDIEDTIKVEVYRGRVAINDTFRIIGCRGLQDESGYHPQIYIQLPTQA